MNILLLDDQGESTLLYKRVLDRAGHEAIAVQHVDVALGKLDRVDLVLIDLMILPAPAVMQREADIVQAGYRNAGQAEMASGQVFGLYLWARRSSLKVPYGYVSSHPEKWLRNLKVDDDTEFAGMSEAERKQLVLDRNALRKVSALPGHCQRLVDIWRTRQWLQ
ncbi:response regulator [Piscinibacter terrae]|nr:response regulator [Albitalea terrae]